MVYCGRRAFVGIRIRSLGLVINSMVANTRFNSSQSAIPHPLPCRNGAAVGLIVAGTHQAWSQTDTMWVERLRQHVEAGSSLVRQAATLLEDHEDKRRVL